MNRFGQKLAVAAAMLVAGTSAASALSPDDKCEASKNKIAGKYAFCRQKAEAKAIKTSSSADYTKCDAKFADKWAKAESKAEGLCPTNGDLAALQAFITQHADDVAAELNGGGLPPPACPSGGVLVAGSCWYLGGPGQSCGTACASHGFLTYSGATETYAGSGPDATLAKCQAVMTALGETNAFVDVVLCTDGFGCARDVVNMDYARCLAPGTNSTAGASTVERACACH